MKNKNVYLEGLEKQMYIEYKTSIFAKGKIPLDFETWKNDILNKQDEQNISIDSNKDYSFNEASKILNKSIATIKLYLKEPEEYGLKLSAANKIEKNGIDELLKRKNESSEKWSKSEQYKNYCKKLFTDKKIPLSYDDYYNENIIKGNEQNINLEEYISFSDTVEYLKLSKTTVSAYIKQFQKFKCLIDGFEDYVLKEDVYKYAQRNNECNCIKCTNCSKELAYTHFKNNSLICNSCVRKLENIKYEEEQQLEREIEKTIRKYSNVYVNGYFICQNSFIKEDYVTHLIPLYKQIRVVTKVKESLTAPSFLANEDGEIINFKSDFECRKVLIGLLKEKEFRNKFNNKF